MKTNKVFIGVMTALLTMVLTSLQAQTSTSESPTTSQIAETIDSTQIDFVTVGSIMPYAIDGNTVSNAWITTYQTLTGKTAALSTVWEIDGTADAGVADMAAINIEWNVATEHSLKVLQSITLEDHPTISCPAAIEKTIYVLPKPEAGLVITDTFAVLGCAETSYLLPYNVSGLGERVVNYTITRTPYNGTAAATDTVVNEGADISNDAYFTNTTSYATAAAAYTAPTNLNIAIDVEAGYIYDVVLTNVNDQISRKSGVEGELTAGKKHFTIIVVPDLDTTPIKHIRNL